MKTLAFIFLFSICSFANELFDITIGFGLSGTYGLKNESFITTEKDESPKNGLSASPTGGIAVLKIRWDHIQWGAGITHSLTNGISKMVSVSSVPETRGPYVTGAYIFDYGHEKTLDLLTFEEIEQDFDAIAIESGYSIPGQVSKMKCGAGMIWGKKSEVMFVPSPYVSVSLEFSL